MKEKLQIKKPFIILLYGFPGSGKTNFARQFAEEFGVVHLEEDRLSQEFFGQKSDDRLQQKAMHYLTEELLRCGVGVIFDSEKSIKTRQRLALKNLATKNKASIFTVWFQIDSDTALGRAQKRDRRKIDDKYAKEYSLPQFKEVLSGMQNPKSGEGYVVVSGKHTFRSQRNAVIKKLYDLDIVATEDIRQSVSVKPGLVNLIPNRTNLSRRNISIR